MEDITMSEYLTMEGNETLRCTSSPTKILWTLENDDDCEDYEINLKKFPAICMGEKNSENSEWENGKLCPSLDETYDAINCNSPLFDELFESISHTSMPKCSIKTYESEEVDLRTIDVDLFTWEPPLKTLFAEFKRLGSIIRCHMEVPRTSTL